MTMLSLDDFEWEQRGFDEFFLMHKTREVSIASIRNFSGWYVRVWKEPTKTGKPLVEHALDLEAAKAMAMLYANKHMKEYHDYIRASDTPKRKRTPEFRPEAVPKGVFRVV